jgi:superfamily I DNA and/or RNA helicase
VELRDVCIEEVATVDVFRGESKDMIVFSAVATTGGWHVLRRKQTRLNVAFARAEKKLIAIAGANVT